MDEIASLLEPQIPGLRRYAWALLRDGEAADDLVQDTLERAISRWSQRRDGDLKAWLFAIQRNLFINGLRRRKARGTRVGEEALNDVPAPGMSPESHAGLHDVLKGLDALPEEPGWQFEPKWDGWSASRTCPTSRPRRCWTSRSAR